MKKLLLLFFAACLCGASGTQLLAQERYIDEIFSEITVTSDVVYGNNITILAALFGGGPAPEDLLMDIYEPAGDTASRRPIVIVGHRGDFLPPVVNESPFGDKTDSSVVAICEGMAKRGYVAVSMTYRLGWNPFGTGIVKKKTILEASYRAAQDIRTCVRFFRKHVAEDNNTYRVDAEKVAVGAFDAAAYAAYSTAFLKNYSQVELPKFVDFSTNPAELFVDSALLGLPYGLENRTLNIGNHTAYSSDVSLVFAFDGGVGDFSWIEAGDPPIVAFMHENKFDQYGIRDVTEGINGDIVIVEAAFPDTIIHRSTELGNQDVLINGNLTDTLSQIAMARSGGLEGLCLLSPPVRTGQIQCDSTAGVSPDNYGQNTYPWNWYDEAWYALAWGSVPGQTVPAAVEICRENLGNPNDHALGQSYVDTINMYLAPRLVLAMNISGTSISSIDNDLKAHLHFKAYPNPVSDFVQIEASKQILAVQVFDMNGRKVVDVDGIRGLDYRIERNSLSQGLYVLKVDFAEGSITEKLLLK